MKKALKGSSFLFYLLAFVLFFILGGLFSVYLGAGKNQGLAGGAIVLGYALMYAVGAVIVAIILASILKTKTVVNANIVLFIIVILFIIIGYLRHLEKEANKIPARQEQYTPKPAAPAQPIQNIQLVNGLDQIFLSSNFVKNDKLYFHYTFNSRAWNGLEETIDNWLITIIGMGRQYNSQYTSLYKFPKIIKMDDVLLMIIVITSGKNMLEVEINQETG